MGRAKKHAPFVHAHLDFGAALVRIGIWFTPCVAIFSLPPCIRYCSSAHTVLYLSHSLIDLNVQTRTGGVYSRWSRGPLNTLSDSREGQYKHTTFEAGSLSQVHRPHGQSDRNTLRAGAIVFRFVCDVFGEVVGSCPRYGTE